MSDWLASRTVRLHAFFVALYAAAMPVLMGFTEADWATIGLSPRGVMIIMGVLNILHSVGGVYMRSITTGPLEGRSK